jgi:hypothetical protein
MFRKDFERRTQIDIPAQEHGFGTDAFWLAEHISIQAYAPAQHISGPDTPLPLAYRGCTEEGMIRLVFPMAETGYVLLEECRHVGETGIDEIISVHP